MQLAPFIIDRFAKFIMGGAPFEAMKRVVTNWHNDDLSGDEKRDAVLHEFAALGYEMPRWLVNLGVELAVAWRKNKDMK